MASFVNFLLTNSSYLLLAPRVKDEMKSVVLPSLSVLNIELKDVR